MPPSTEGGVAYGSATKVMLAEESDIRKRGNGVPVMLESNYPTKPSPFTSKQDGKSILFYLKKLAWTLFTIPMCRAVVFVTFAVVRMFSYQQYFAPSTESVTKF